jgi:DnaJ-class molecular chaperone
MTAKDTLCFACHGTGEDVMLLRCTHCGGTGMQRDPEEYVTRPGPSAMAHAMRAAEIGIAKLDEKKEWTT